MVDRYGTLETPSHLLQKTADTKEEFQRLLAKATERANQITDTLASWRDFQNGLREFSDWLRSSLSELSSLRAVEMFLQEFSSLESRLQVGVACPYLVRLWVGVACPYLVKTVGGCGMSLFG